jgi:uncharacterized repeat protein (TIGR02543 family)
MKTATVEPDNPNGPDVSTYVVTFDLNYTGAANPPKPQEIDAGDKVTIPTPPKREGYTFDGWFLDAAGTGAAWDFALNTVTTNLDLYAKWTRTYTVTFNLSGAPGTAPVHPAVLYEGKITIPDPAPQWAGWTFEHGIRRRLALTLGTSARTPLPKTRPYTRSGRFGC